MDVVEILGKIGFDSKVFLFNLTNFIILALLLKKFLFDKMAGVMEERQKTIAAGLDKFDKSEQHIIEAKEKSLEILEEAKAKGNEIIKNSLKEAEKEAEILQLNAKKAFEEEKNRNSQKLDRQKKQMLEEFKEEAATYLVAEMKGKI